MGWSRCLSRVESINEALSMKSLALIRTNPLSDGFDAAPGESRHCNKARGMGNDGAFRRRRLRKEFQKRCPKLVLWFKFFAGFSNVTNDLLAPLKLRKVCNSRRPISFCSKHCGAESN